MDLHELIYEIRKANFRFVQRSSPPLKGDVYLYLGRKEFKKIRELGSGETFLGMILVEVLLESHLNISNGM